MERLKSQEKVYLHKQYLIFVSLLSFLFIACNSSSEKEISSEDIYFDYGYNEDKNHNLPQIEFEKEEYNFGILTEGEKVSHTFKFKNSGKSDLIISSVEASCGCTVPKKYTKEPISPGAEGTIDVVFDSANKAGDLKKTITVLTNCIPNKKVLFLTGEVIALERLNQLKNDQ